MPFVEVWVEAECDGNCQHAKAEENLLKRMEVARQHLAAGDTDLAIKALDPNEKCPTPCSHSIAASYAAWKAGRLPGFTNYRHDSTSAQQ